MIDTAVILAAGQGSRLRDAAPIKPLCEVGGRALIDHALHGLAEAGLRRAIVVLGHEGDAIAAHLARGRQPLAVETAWMPDPTLPNGVSALAAAEAVGGHEALLVMCDHLVAPALYARVARKGAGDGVRLGIDRRLEHPWVDNEDVTRVRTDGDLIAALGKGLEPYDAHDTGVFAVGPALFHALAALPAPSLTDGVRMLAGEGRARIVDCSGLEWIDVDDAAALVKAETWLAESVVA